MRAIAMAVVVVKAEEYDGTYECVICSESVRGEPALKCAQCNANPVHVACVVGSIYTEACSVCKREMMKPFGSSRREAGTEARAPTLASEAHDEAEGERGAMDPESQEKAIKRAKKGNQKKALPQQETCRQLGALDPQSRSQERIFKRAKRETRRKRCRNKRHVTSWGEWTHNHSRRPLSRHRPEALQVTVMSVGNRASAPTSA